MEYVLGRKLRINLVSKIFILAFSLLSNSLAILANQPEWLANLKKLKVTASLRNEVENVFVYKKIISISNLALTEDKGWGKEIKYKTKFGILEATYSTGNCLESKTPYGFNIEKDGLVDLTLYLYKPVYLKKVSLTGYKLYKSPDVVSVFTYTNSLSGLSLSGRKGKINQVKLDMIPEQAAKLSCQQN